MTRTCSFTLIWLALGIAAWFADGADRAVAAPVRQLDPAPASALLPVRGGIVDSNVPATYRLPRVPTREGPAARVASISPLFSPPPPVTRRAIVQSHAAPATPSDANALEKPRLQPIERNPAPAESPPDQLLEEVAAEDHDAPSAIELIPYAPTTAELTSQLLPAVQRGFGLAQRGALFAARTEFVQVMRRVAQAADAAAGNGERSQALAAGLRALDEAEDFVPDGVELEAELDVRATASSHRTPVLAEHSGNVLPHDAAASYHRFAQQQLSGAMADEQAGSMALYGLGRIYAQLAEQRDGDVHLTRGAMTMYAAAFEASPQNHLAANELGVLLFRTGRAADATRLFKRAIDCAPSATAYHNLAVAQQKLGLPAEAQANEQESQRLAAWERATGVLSRRVGVEWVAPDEMARIAQPAALTPRRAAANSAVPVARPMPQPNRRRWR